MQKSIKTRLFWKICGIFEVFDIIKIMNCIIQLFEMNQNESFSFDFLDVDRKELNW